MDTYIVDSLTAGRRFEFEENNVSDSHFRAWRLMGSVGTRKLGEEENQTKNNGGSNQLPSRDGV